jgi:hypothetical protein
LHAAVVIRTGDPEPLSRDDIGVQTACSSSPCENPTPTEPPTLSSARSNWRRSCAALVPSSHTNGMTYHGIVAPRHRFRNHVIQHTPEHDSRERLTKKPAKSKPGWYAWADCLWHVFEIDGLACVVADVLPVTRSFARPQHQMFSTAWSALRNAKRDVHHCPYSPPLEPHSGC